MWRIIFSPSPETLDFPFETQCDCETLLSLKTFTPPPPPPTSAQPKVQVKSEHIQQVLEMKDERTSVCSRPVYCWSETSQKARRWQNVRRPPQDSLSSPQVFTYKTWTFKGSPACNRMPVYRTLFVHMCVCVSKGEVCTRFRDFSPPGCRGGHAEHFVCS